MDVSPANAAQVNPHVRSNIAAQCMIPNPPRTVHIEYIDSKGERKNRHVEPYEIRGDTLFAFCRADGHIKQFKISRIQKATPGEIFKPTQAIVTPI